MIMSIEGKHEKHCEFLLPSVLTDGLCETNIFGFSHIIKIFDLEVIRIKITNY